MRILAVLGILVSVATEAQASEKSCAKISKISGSNCETLKVEFDLSACKESAVGDSEINCKGDTARASIATSTSIFSVDLIASEAWGTKSYSPSDDVRRSASVHEKESKKSERVSKTNAKRPSEQKAKKHDEPQKAKEALKSSDAAHMSDQPLSISGAFDAYYAFNFNRPGTASRNLVTSADATNSYRAYDAYHNSFGLNLAELEFKKTSGEVSFLADLDFGQQVDLNHSAFGKFSLTSPTSGTVTTYDGISKTDEISKHIGQAIVTWSPGWANGASLSVGKMYTHIGYEVPKAKDNWNYSRSTIYWYSLPVWHLGAALASPLYEDKISGSLFVYNGWNNLTDNNSGKTFGAQLKITPNSDFTFVYNLIAGPERDNNNSDWRVINEANATYVLDSKVSLALETVVGYESSAISNNTEAAKWFGTSLHARYQPCSFYWMSPRFEYYRDNDGYSLATSTPENLYSWTLTTGLIAGHGLEFRLEGRLDYSKDSELFKTGSRDLSRFQFTGTLGALFSF